MNINFISKITTAAICSVILVSCQSHEQKPDDAFEQVMAEKKLINDSNLTSREQPKTKDSVIVKKEILKQSNKAEIVTKTIIADEWTIFKAETEKKIVSNEKLIKTLKATPDATNKVQRKTSKLEKENSDLRKQMDDYFAERKALWGKFKSKMNTDADEIAIELKDLTVNNKK